MDRSCTKTSTENQQVQKSTRHGKRSALTVSFLDNSHLYLLTHIDRGAVVPQNLAAKSGLTHKHVHIQEKYGGGYPANVEGLHHLHCLNLLRQGLYFNYAYYQARGDGAFSNEEPILQLHISISPLPLTPLSPQSYTNINQHTV
jgi:hypothetical protein